MSKCKKSIPINFNGAEDDIDCTGAAGTMWGFMILIQLQTFNQSLLHHLPSLASRINLLSVAVYGLDQGVPSLHVAHWKLVVSFFLEELIVTCQ